MTLKPKNKPVYNLFESNKYSRVWSLENESEDLNDIVQALEEIVEDDDDFDINSVKVVKVCDEGVFQLNVIFTLPAKAEVEIQDRFDYRS